MEAANITIGAMIEYSAASASSVPLGQRVALDAKIEWICPNIVSWFSNRSPGTAKTGMDAHTTEL